MLIARAIASKPSILIFDEAVSSLDNITQQKITEALKSLNCTRIVVSHRLSTIQKCNRILVIENGKIAEEGAYDDLIEKNEIFYGWLMDNIHIIFLFNILFSLIMRKIYIFYYT